MKKNIAIFTFMLALLAGCGHNHGRNGASDGADSLAVAADSLDEPIPVTLASLPDEPLFDIQTSMGTIRVKLYSKTPRHKANFAKLALSGFYDSTLFHRVINGFMIQGGDPLTRDTSRIEDWGTGGPGYTVQAEFVPEYTHKKGALCAARMGDVANPKKESSGSQFYIVQNADACSHLNGEYTVFGETVLGIETVDRIAGVLTDFMDRPVDDVRIITVKYVPQK